MYIVLFRTLEEKCIVLQWLCSQYSGFRTGLAQCTKLSSKHERKARGRRTNRTPAYQGTTSHWLFAELGSVYHCCFCCAVHARPSRLPRLSSRPPPQFLRPRNSVTIHSKHVKLAKAIWSLSPHFPALAFVTSGERLPAGSIIRRHRRFWTARLQVSASTPYLSTLLALKSIDQGRLVVHEQSICVRGRRGRAEAATTSREGTRL